MFLVDDDQPRILQRREQRGAGADDDVRLAVARRQPGVEPLAVGQRRMQQGDARVEAALEARQGLRTEVDLRDQHQRLAAGFQGLVDQLQVDLGLAAAGDAGQQIAAEAAETGFHRLERGALLGVERQFGLRQPAAMVLDGRLAALLQADQALFLQQVEAVLVDLQLAQQFVGDAVGMLQQDLQRLALARCAGQPRVFRAGAGLRVPEALQPRLGRFALAQQVGQRPGQRVAEAVLVVLGGPAAQFEQVCRQWRLAVEHRQRRAQLVFRYFGALGQLDQHADDLAPAERHPQAHAGAQVADVDPAWRQVVEQPAQRRGQGEAQDAGLGHAADSVAAGTGDLSTLVATVGRSCSLHGRGCLV
ncbi:hypothetical protein D9M71_143860 [compost metagenome]